MSYYEVLGVEETAEANDIRAAYLRLVQQYHPDRHVDDEVQRDDAERFKQIQQAYEILYDPERRKAYDRQRLVPQPRNRRPNTVVTPVRRTPRRRRDVPDDWMPGTTGRRTGRRSWRSLAFMMACVLIAAVAVPQCGQFLQSEPEVLSPQPENLPEHIATNQVLAHVDDPQLIPAPVSEFEILPQSVDEPADVVVASADEEAPSPLEAVIRDLDLPVPQPEHDLLPLFHDVVNATGTEPSLEDIANESALNTSANLNGKPASASDDRWPPLQHASPNSLTRLPTGSTIPSISGSPQLPSRSHLLGRNVDATHTQLSTSRQRLQGIRTSQFESRMTRLPDIETPVTDPRAVPGRKPQTGITPRLNTPLRRGGFILPDADVPNVGVGATSPTFRSKRLRTLD